ncbi:MAG: T9SS type A sorting domain-containing protein [Candidatus Cloacimonetes bacterium]|nr:T9SS type A sorting domain-containing protein [Candidatus Cloacimonadota bacterium]
MKKAALILALLGILMLGTLSAKDTNALESIEINPNPMSKHTDVTLVFSQCDYISVTVQTAVGQVVKTLYTGQAQEYMVLGWNREGDDGSFTPSGSYYVVVTQGRYTSTKKTLILK